MAANGQAAELTPIPHPVPDIATMLSDAYTAYMHGNYPGAERLIESAIEITRASGDRFNEANALALAATYAQRTINREQAAARGEEALIVAGQSANFRASAEACIALCITYGEMGMIDEAIRMAEDARSYAKQSNDARLLSYAHTRTADAYVAREVVYGIPCTQAALGHYRIARRLARGLTEIDVKVAAQYNHMLALMKLTEHPLDPIIFRSKRRLKVAAMLADRVIALTEPSSAQSARRFVVFNCALVWCKVGRVTEAFAVFESHEATAKEMGGMAYASFQNFLGLTEIAAGREDIGCERLEQQLLEPMRLGSLFAMRFLQRRALIEIALKNNAPDVACRHLLAFERERRIEFNHQNVMREAVDRRLGQLRDATKEADTDPLTQLLNRRGFPAKIAHAFESAKKQGRPLALAMLDIDHFKQVNDQFGHLIGDQVLRFVALVIKKHCGDNDLVGRYGGDEFVIVAFDTTRQELLKRCEAIRLEVWSTAPASFESINTISISAGVSDSSEALDINGLIHQADSRLYFAKQNGRNSVQG